MYDDHPRVAFRLDADTLAQVQTLADRHDQSLSQVCRDALRLLLSDLPRYHALLATRATRRYAPPTPAAMRYVEEHAGVDLDAIAAAQRPT